MIKSVKERSNAGLMANSAKAYYNAEACTYDEGYTNAEAYTNADAYNYIAKNRLHECTESNAHECNQFCSKLGHSQKALAIVNIHAPPRETINETASTITDRTTTCETMINNASAIIRKNSMSSQ